MEASFLQPLVAGMETIALRVLQQIWTWLATVFAMEAMPSQMRVPLTVGIAKNVSSLLEQTLQVLEMVIVTLH
jgi:hypothetical protein